jgi:hypothetical protein
MYSHCCAEVAAVAAQGRRWSSIHMKFRHTHEHDGRIDRDDDESPQRVMCDMENGEGSDEAATAR